MTHKYLIVLLIATTLSKIGSAQATNAFPTKIKTALRAEVIAAARHGWEGYKKYAWAMDDLEPLAKKGKNWYAQSLLMTPVDAFDTFVMLGMEKEAKEAKAIILSKLNFNVDNNVQVFEVTIRL